MCNHHCLYAHASAHVNASSGHWGRCACRLILFLQQSSVEWASSLWMHVVQELDPQYQRTVSVSPQ